MTQIAADAIGTMMNEALRCKCGGALKPSKTKNYSLATLTDIRAEVTGAACLACEGCSAQLISDETRDELLLVLLSSVALSWRRLYPEDVRFVRAHLKLSVAKFIDLLALDEKIERRTGTIYVPGSPPQPTEKSSLEDHHVYISDVASNRVKDVAREFLGERRLAAIVKKWHPWTIISGEHRLTTKEWFGDSLEKLKHKCADLMETVNECRRTLRGFLAKRVEEAAEREWQDALPIDGTEHVGVELSRLRFNDSGTGSVWALREGGFLLAYADGSRSDVLPAEEMIERMLHGEMEWARASTPRAGTA